MAIKVWKVRGGLKGEPHAMFEDNVRVRSSSPVDLAIYHETLH